MQSIFLSISMQTQADLVMSVSGIFGVLCAVLMVFCGGYGLYSAIRLHRERDLFRNRLLYPNYCAPNDCLDPDGYVCYILPRISVLSVVMLLGGILLSLSRLLPILPNIWVYLVVLVLPFAVYIWYLQALKKAAKRFW